MTIKASEYFLKKFEEIELSRNLKTRGRRIGSELKFPAVKRDGSAIGSPQTGELWDFLVSKGWTALADNHTGETVGAVKPGEMNEHRASCETGFCKIEFSLAHTDNLMSLSREIQELKKLIGEFSEQSGVIFLGYGLQPLTRPGKHLLMKKSRNLFWDRLFGGNDHITPGNGTDVHLFTISASNQTHIDVTMDEAVDAVNVFNGIVGGQIALTANSNIWRGHVDPEYKCLGEIFWDWWLKDAHNGRYGVPERKFNDLDDYFRSILQFPPVYVRREGVPLALPHCGAFSNFFSCNAGDNGCGRKKSGDLMCGITAEGEEAEVLRQNADLDQHFTFFWHNARLSRYYTLENRVNDQQPPEEMMCVPALTLGVMENLGSAKALVDSYPWEVLREMRLQACRYGLGANVRGINATDLSRGILEIAEEGLKRRCLGEEIFLEPLRKRLDEGLCPADRAARIFREEGMEGFVEKFAVRKP